jgi:hypothetical protein
MEQAVTDSRFVILVCTQTYRARANKRRGGVGYESMVITAELAEQMLTNKFIPVLRQGTWNSSLPIYLKTRMGVDLRDEPYREDEYEKLLRVLHGELIQPPPLAKKPAFSEKRGFKSGASPVSDATERPRSMSLKTSSAPQPPVTPSNAISEVPGLTCHWCGAPVQTDEDDDRQYHCQACGAFNQWSD